MKTTKLLPETTVFNIGAKREPTLNCTATPDGLVH